MSWLRNHMQEFVLPGIRTLARADGRTILDQDINPSLGRRVRPSTKCEYEEAGLLMALCSSILKKSNPVREVAIGLCRQVGKPGDAEFVYELDLGGRGYDNRVKDLAFGYQDVEGADVLHSFIQNSVKELKARTRKRATAIYPGRDVWCWEVMSQRQGMPSHYDSKVSRSIATNEKAIAKVIEPWEIPDWEKTVLFDTGHQGTVPRAIGKAAGLEKMNVIMLSAVNNEEQLFRTHAKSRKKALACEYLAKYRKRAVVQNDEAYQEIADLEEFIKASLLTIWLWYHVSPARLPAWRDQEVVRTKSGLRFAAGAGRKGNIAVGNSSQFTINANPIWQVQTASTGWGGTGGTNVQPMWLSSSSGATTTAGNIGFWDNSNTTTTLDGLWGSGATAQLINAGATPTPQPPAPFTPAVDPTTFKLIDPVSGIPIESAMDARDLGMDAVEYEVWRARANLQQQLARFVPFGFRGETLKRFDMVPPSVIMDVTGTKVLTDNRPPPPPNGVGLLDHIRGLQASKITAKPIKTPYYNSQGQQTATPQLSSKDIVDYEKSKMMAAMAKANNDTAKRLEPIKDKIPQIMAAANQPLNGQLPLIQLGFEIDKDTGKALKTVTYKSPLIPSQPGGVPLTRPVPIPTTGQGNPVTPVTDGSGKAII